VLVNATCLDTIRLTARANANKADAELWRWYADAVEERQIRHVCKGRTFEVTLGPHKTEASSFDEAIRRMKETIDAQPLAA
jgi:hypothetical protein